MRTTENIKNDILVSLGVSTTVGFYTDQIVNDWIDKAHKWAAGYKKWTATEGRISTTYAVDNTDIEVGFNYPEGWKPDSIRLLQIGGKRFRKVNFYKYMEFREDFPNDTGKVFTDHGKLYFVNPQADASGTTTMWGQFTPATLDATDTTALSIFSDNFEEANEAISEEVMSYAKKKEKKLDESLAHHKKAQEILLEKLEQIKEEQFGYQITDDDGMFSRFDVLQGDFRSDIIKRNQWF